MSEVENKPLSPVLPTKTVIQYQNSLRNSDEFWRFRSVTNVLRQTRDQIENYRKRYATNS